MVIHICRNLQNLLKLTPAIPANPHLKSLVTDGFVVYACDARQDGTGLRCHGGRRGKRPVGDVELGKGSGFGHDECGSGCIECKCMETARGA